MLTSSISSSLSLSLLLVSQIHTIIIYQRARNSYDYLIVAPGLKTDFNKIPGLLEALQDPSSKVSTIYKEDSVEQVWEDIKGFEGGKAVS